jgi:drug/metabolite transporter (DMT)-like permease
VQLGEQLALSAAFVWSVAVILIRLSGLELGALALTIFKSAVAALAFFITLPFLNSTSHPQLSWQDWSTLVVSGVLGISVADTMVVAALNRLGASLHALADCLYTPSMALMGYLLFAESLNGWEVVGGMLVIGGVAFGMRLTKEVPNVRALLSGLALAAGAHVIMAVGILIARDIYAQHSVVWVSGVRFAVATLVLVLYAYFRGQTREISEGLRRRDLWKWTIPLSLLGPYLATMFWALGFVYTKAGRAAVFNQMSTVFVTVLAIVVLKESINMRKMAGLFLAVVGSFVVANS